MQLLSKEETEYLKSHKEEITQELLEELRKQGNEGKKQVLEILDLEKDSDNYYLDAYNNRISYNGLRTLKKAFTKHNLSEIHKIELEKCYNDILYFLSNYVRITTPKGFDFAETREYQRDFLKLMSNDEIENIIALMPRQSSKSVTTSIKLAHLFLFSRDLTIGIVAQKGETAREFLDKTKKILINLPIWMQAGLNVWNKGSIECENNVRILTDVPSGDSFRGYSCNIIVVDECAFIDPKNWNEFADSIFPAQSGLAFKKNVILSTAKGKNHFYDIWINAGESLEKSKNEYIRYSVNSDDVPRYKSNGERYTPEEFKSMTIRKNGLVYWKQNYECSFLGSAETLIHSEILNSYKIKEPIDIDKIKDSEILTYEEPIKGHRYVMGVDTAKEGDDYTAIQIFDFTDLNFRQVVSAQLKIDYVLLPELLFEYGNRYNCALAIVENNEGSGQVVADILKRDYEYENLYYDYNINTNKRQKYPGYRTTKITRDVMLQTVSMLAKKGKLELCDKKTIKEFETFIMNDKGKFEATYGNHDDLVMSVCLCFGIFNIAKNFEDFKEVVDLIMTKDSEYIGSNILSFGMFADGI